MKVCTKNSRSLEDYLYLTGWIFLLTGSIGIYLYLHIVLPNLQGYTCMVYRLFGFYCPGCGGTRAVSALLAGHPLSSTGNLYRCYLWRLYVDTDSRQIAYRWDQRMEVP